MKSWLAVVIILLGAWQCSAASLPYNDYWQRGNKYYAAKEYDSAAFYFSQLAQATPDAPEVYYNLGNAHYRLNNIGEAILNYSKALHLKPGYKQAADNLELTQSRIKNRIAQPQDIFFVRWWKAIANPATAGIWAIVSLLLFISLLTLIYLGRVLKSASSQAVIGVGFLLVISLIVAFAASQTSIDHDQAVVMEETVFRTDGKGASVQVPEGTIVVLEANDGSAWTKVSLPDGRVGNVQQRALEKI